MLGWDLHNGFFAIVEAEVEGLVVQTYDASFSGGGKVCDRLPTLIYFHESSAALCAYRGDCSFLELFFVKGIW